MDRCKYVRVWTGRHVDGDSNSAVESYEGFLLKDDGASFDALMLDWSVETLAKAGTEPGMQGFAGYRESSMKDDLRHLPARLANRSAANGWSHSSGARINEFKIGWAGQIFALARQCALRGQSGLSDTLLARLNALCENRSPGEAVVPLEEMLQREFAGALTWDAICAFSGEGVSRADLLAQFRNIQTLCPAAGEALDIARDHAKSLEQQITEDAAHTAVSAAKFAELPPEGKAAELAYRLRDETLNESPRDEDRIHRYALRPSNGSYAGLVALGTTAVPALLAAMESEGNTRIVLGPNFFGQVGHLKPIREAATDALDEIAGFHLHWAAPIRDEMTAEERESTVRKFIFDWKAAVEEKQERAFLAANLTANRYSEEVTAALFRRYPEEAPRELAAFIPKVSEPQIRTRYCKLLWKQDTPECRAFLAREALTGPTLENRVTAAIGLQLLDDPQGVRTMLTEWQSVRKSLPEKLASFNQPYISNSPLHLLSFLTTSAAPEAIIILGRESGPLPAEWVQLVIKMLEERVSERTTGAGAPANPGTILAIQDLLTSFLDDKTLCAASIQQTRSSVRNQLIIRPRLCDHAAEALHELWPKRYPFDGAVSPEARDRQCVESGNVRRRERGETLGELPGKTGKAPPPPSRPCQITGIEWEPGSRELAGKWGLKFEAFRGRTLESGPLVSLLSSFAAKPIEGATGVTLEMVRYADVRGVTLCVALQTDRPDPTNHAAPWEVWVRRAESDGGESDNKGAADAVATWKCLEDAIAIERADRTAKAFTIRVELHRVSTESNGTPSPEFIGIPGLN